MTAKEIRAEIARSLDKAPETVLKDVLYYLKHTVEHSRDDSSLAKNLLKILGEDKELLEKLAR